MSTFTSLFRFHPRTRVEEQHVRLVINLTTNGVVASVGGNSSFVLTAARAGTGIYTITFKKPMKYLITGQATVDTGTNPPAHGAAANLYGIAADNATTPVIKVCITANNIPADLSAGAIHIDLVFATSSVSFA